jgi:DNA-binding response OmpR family regulator
LFANPSGGNAVLVIDDDDDVREAMADAVKQLGRVVFTATDGLHALRLLEGNAIPRPCLILLDWAMARMNGEEFLQSLTERADPSELRVFIMSASAEVPPLPGVLGTLRKPFHFGELEAILDKYC